MGWRAFTLIELMIVVAIISIIVAIAVPHLLRSRMAANETAAIASCRVIGESESIYHRTDFDRDGVLEYAQNLQGNASLLENVAGAGDLQMIDSALAKAEGNPGATTARVGYVFAVQTGQGNNTGNPCSYLTNDPTGGGTSMTIGFAISAVPAQYDTSGRNSYAMSHTGLVYQHDFGATTNHPALYDPDATWMLAQ